MRRYIYRHLPTLRGFGAGHILAAALLTVYAAPLAQLASARPPVITHEGLSWVNHLGGGIDDQGFYRYAIPIEQVFGQPSPDGWYPRSLTGLEGETTSLLFLVENNHLIRMMFSFQGKADASIAKRPLRVLRPH
ncbi:MAG: hypothetical protein KME20_05170 [Kaiparowitsia implicata GSE-PSE-MK54-09C]|jgi:hypothetical protein|nr:hypothetical protein [Kaiparowitsia implicata GSE-PSE-MK54-09C]